MVHIVLSKFDIAERQLLQAIKMFFRDEDPVSINTLTEAASQRLYDIGKRYSSTNLLRDSDLIRDDKKGSVTSLLSESKNFFKHADRDQNAYYEFKPVFNHVSLIDAVNLYSAIKRKYGPETFVYLAWYNREYPYHIKEEFGFKSMLETVSRALPHQKDKHAWYNFIRMLRRGRILNKKISLEYGL